MSDTQIPPTTPTGPTGPTSDLQTQDLEGSSVAGVKVESVKPISVGDQSVSSTDQTASSDQVSQLSQAPLDIPIGSPATSGSPAATPPGTSSLASQTSPSPTPSSAPAEAQVTEADVANVEAQLAQADFTTDQAEADPTADQQTETAAPEPESAPTSEAPEAAAVAEKADDPTPIPTQSPDVPDITAAPPAAQAPQPAVLPSSDPASANTGLNGQTGAEDLTGLIGILARKGALAPDQAGKLQFEAINSGSTVEQLLRERQLVSEVALTEALSEQYNIPFISVESTGVSPEALTLLPEGVARRYNMLPFAVNKQENTLSVAMLDPLDLSAIDFASQKTGYRIIPHYATPSELERKIAERYAQNLSTEVTAALEDSEIAPKQDTSLEDLSALSKGVVRQAPITKIVETILSFAIKARASDVHIEPHETRTRVRYRIDGILAEKLILPKSVHEAVVSRVKILSDLKIDEKRVPQDGRFSFRSNGEEVDLRVSTLPTIHGEKIVMRLLKKNITVPSLPDLGLRGYALRHVQEAVRVPHGIILVTGPTGSGKTTTLYSVLHKINQPSVNILTLEDPVEYEIQGVNQVQINPQAGLSFASGLRSFLRQDPNVIMVGEIRDTETAELAIQASLTGHLVFSTLHTSSAAGAIPRLLDMGAEPFLVASSMTLAMGQRIVRQINPDYKEEYQPDPAVIEDIKQVLGPLFDSWCKQHNKKPEEITLFRASEQRPQSEPAYKGRIGIFEVLRITEEIGRMIMEQKTATDMEKVAIKDGMLLMKQDGYLKVLEGLTTIEEVLRVAEV